MLKKEDIFTLINNRAIDKNGVLLLDYSNTKEIIGLCEKSNIDVLGIDVFSLHESTIQPIMDKSVDFSSEFSKYTTPGKYLKQLNDDYSKQLFFEITI